MGNLKHALAEKDNTKRSVNYTDADRPKQQAYDTAVRQAEAITMPMAATRMKHKFKQRLTN